MGNEYIAIGTMALLILLFIVFRFVVLWYFKINERTKLLKEILNILTAIEDKL